MSFVGNILKSLPVIGDVARGIENDKRARQVVVPDDPTYTTNPEVAARLAYAKTLLGARRPGAATAAQGIYTAAGNAVTNINRNATNSAQALALATGVQGQTDAALAQQSTLDEQYAQQARQELVAAQMAQAQEGRYVYDDLLRKRYNAVNERNQYRNAAEAGFANVGNTLLNIGTSVLTGGIPLGGGKKNSLAGIDTQTLQNAYYGG